MHPTEPLVRGVDGIDELGVRRGFGGEHVFTVPTSCIPAVTHVTKRTNFSSTGSAAQRAPRLLLYYGSTEKMKSKFPSLRACNSIEPSASANLPVPPVIARLVSLVNENAPETRICPPRRNVVHVQS